METESKTPVTVQTLVNAPLEKTWTYWEKPEHIMQWNQASEDWHSPCSENDLRTGGKFKTTMAAKDGSMSFDFEGTYTNVEANKVIEYAMGDGRKVKVIFEEKDGKTQLTETFDPEGTNPVEMQRTGWQAILDSFKKYTEEN